MTPKKKNIGELLRKYGYAFPKSSDEVRSFEKKFSKKDYISPKNWPDIQDIINPKDSVIPVFKIKEEDNNASINLAIAAREGKGISKKDREQMDKDKKNARKK